MHTQQEKLNYGLSPPYYYYYNIIMNNKILYIYIVYIYNTCMQVHVHTCA